MNARSEILRALADLLDTNPDLEMPDIDGFELELMGIRFQLTSHGSRAAEHAALVSRTFPGSFTKTYGDVYYNMRGTFCGVPVTINALRSDVCTARQVGTTTKKIQDPAALAAVPKIEIEVPVYEYDCKPILAEVAS